MSKIKRIHTTQSLVASLDFPENFLLLRERQTSKLGQRAHGQITYQVLLDPSRSRVFLRIIANEGSGSFSNKPVPVQGLQACVAQRDRLQLLRSGILKPAIQGRSACNAGFIAAALVEEGLLERDPEKRHNLHDVGLWSSWTQEQLATPGELTEIRLETPAKPAIASLNEANEASGSETSDLVGCDEPSVDVIEGKTETLLASVSPPLSRGRRNGGE
jgi:hypothetical protein